MLVVLCFVATADARTLRLNGTTMGTSYSVQMRRIPAKASEESLRNGIDRLLTTIEQQMSTYRPDSELSRFNRADSTAWIPVSPDVATVVIEALRVSRLSGGAFDVTLGPLVDLWGFGVDRRSRRRPDTKSLEATLERVGYERLEVRESPPALRKQRQDLTVDLSAIAKGFGVDRIAAYLDDNDIGDYLIELGGELRGRGPRGKEWTVAIEQPEPGVAAAMSVVRLGAAAVATSGSYRNFFEEDGQRYSHVIDPRTGLPVGHELASVSVVASTTMRADALATALLVLGPDAGLRLAEKEDIAALFVTREADGFRAQRTKAFTLHELPTERGS